MEETLSNRLTKSRPRNERLVEIDRKDRNARRKDDKAFAITGPAIRLKAAAYLLRRGYLTRRERRAANFIEGRWTPPKGHSKEDERVRRQLRPMLALTMAVPRFHSNKREGQHKGILRRFLTGLFKHTAAA